MMLEVPVTEAQEDKVTLALWHALGVYANGSRLESPVETAVETKRMLPVASAMQALFAALMV